MEGLQAPPSGGLSETNWLHRFVEKVVDEQSCSLTYNGLQLRRSSIAELLEAGEVLQQSEGLNRAYPGDLQDHTQDQWVQQLK